MAKIGWGRILAGVATVAAAGAAIVYLRQRSAKAPGYDLLLSDGAVEIRRYPAVLVIETDQPGSRDRALGTGFGVLAAYMFGEGREGEEIPIAMPVLARLLGDGRWRIRFPLPDGLDRSKLDPPGPDIAIREIPAREVAVITAPGKPTDRLFAARAGELQRWIAARGRMAAGGVEHAYHTSPLGPDIVRPNEVVIPLNP